MEPSYDVSRETERVTLRAPRLVDSRQALADYDFRWRLLVIQALVPCDPQIVNSCGIRCG